MNKKQKFELVNFPLFIEIFFANLIILSGKKNEKQKTQVGVIMFYGVGPMVNPRSHQYNLYKRKKKVYSSHVDPISGLNLHKH